MENHPENSRDLILLEQIEQNPDVTQASMAVHLGVAVGTINWHLKRLINKGYVKVRRAERRKLRYIITPEGITLRAHLTLDYLQTQFRLYRQTRQMVINLLEVDVADICRLTCLEQAVSIVNDIKAPVLVVIGLKVNLQLEKQHG
jgi:predicted transcriptional regulator